jgi:hypothetical protein
VEPGSPIRQLSGLAIPIALFVFLAALAPLVLELRIG